MKSENLNRIATYTAIFSSISTVIIMIFSLLSLKSSIQQFEESNSNTKKQIALLERQIKNNETIAYSTLPAELRIKPEYMLQPNDGKYEIEINNSNLYDLNSIKYSINYFLGCWTQSEEFRLKTNYLSTIPIPLIDTLKTNSSERIVINRKELNSRIQHIKTNNKECIGLVKFEIFYRRSIDKKEFISKIIYLDVNGTLVDLKNDNLVPIGGLNLKEIKSLLE